MNTQSEQPLLNDYELISKQIGQKIKQRREELGLTLEDLSEKSDLDFYDVDTLEETGWEGELDIFELSHICNVLQMKVSDFFI